MPLTNPLYIRCPYAHVWTVCLSRVCPSFIRGHGWFCGQHAGGHGCERGGPHRPVVGCRLFAASVISSVDAYPPLRATGKTASHGHRFTKAFPVGVVFKWFNR